MSLHAIATLNDLIETLKDGEEGFRAASGDVQSAELRRLFEEFSEQRSRFAGELQELVRGFGEMNPVNTSSAVGALHRGWINLKAVLTSRDDHAILVECERGEDSAIAEYRHALEAELPANARAVVLRQAAEVQAAHDQVRDLRDATASE
ncbi:MAG: hypothetical protein QOE70_6231 [Chthoniobacter sp.]|jgi:uncharacterized protein (TIGR02284 family)|nr:hypothetical protein [Chthoniobacter sp.]